jgi:hypothetical protein
MRQFSAELLLALFVAGFWLMQWLYKAMQRKSMPVPRQDDPLQDYPPLASDFPPWSTEVAPTAAIPQATTKPRPAMGAPGRKALRTRRHRFSRQGLMPNRRAVQQAVVLAAILNPCHAHRPHGTD